MESNVFSVQEASQSLGLALWQATIVWQRKLKAVLDPFQVSHTQFVLMASLLWFEMQDADLVQVDLIHHCRLDKMTVSKSLKKLELEGYIERTESLKDTRAKKVKLTPEGKKLARKLVNLIEAEDARFFNRLNPSKRQQLLGALQELSKF